MDKLFDIVNLPSEGGQGRICRWTRERKFGQVRFRLVSATLSAAVMADAWLSSILWVSEACLRSFGRIPEAGAAFRERHSFIEFTYRTVPGVPGRCRCRRRIPAGGIGVELLVDGFDNNFGGFRIQKPLLLKEPLKTTLTSPFSGVKSPRRGCGCKRLLRGRGCRLMFPADVQHKSWGYTLTVPLWLKQAFAEAKGGSEQRGKLDQHHNYTRIPRIGPFFQRVSRSTKSCSSSLGAISPHEEGANVWF